MSAGTADNPAPPPPTNTVHLIHVQSKAQQQLAHQQRLNEADPDQHAHPPGMLAEEPVSSSRRPSGLIISTHHNQPHQSTPTPLTPQQLAKTAAQQPPPLNALNGSLQEQSMSGSYYSDEEGDAESSEDESPRENRVLTFADEHGKNLVAIHWYEPDPGEDNRGVPGGGATVTVTHDETVVTGCGGCVIL